MSNEKKYLLEWECTVDEQHDGEKWVTEEEIEKIKHQAGHITPGCDICTLTVKDVDGNVLFIKPGC